MAELSETTLWDGASETLTGRATGGRAGVATYKVTNRFIYVTSGTLRTDSQQIPIIQVQDVDMAQTVAQKMRGVGDVRVFVSRSDGTRGQLVIASVRGAAQVRDLINQSAHQAAQLAQQVATTQTVHYNGTAPAPAPASGPSLPDQVRQLAELRDQGLLTEEEFTAKKAQLLGL